MNEMPVVGVNLRMLCAYVLHGETKRLTLEVAGWMSLEIWRCPEIGSSARFETRRRAIIEALRAA